MMTPAAGSGASMPHAELRFTRLAEHIMGMPALQKHRWTAADVRELIDERLPWPRYELLDGELLVTPAPARPHQFAVSALLIRLGNYCNSEGIGVALASPADIELAPETIMQPDVFVVPQELIRYADDGDWRDFHWLVLAVEVLSPSTSQQDRVRKRDFYLANGVRDYWVVDLDARVVESWRPNVERPEIHRTEVVWRPAGARSPLRIDLEAFFVHDCRLPRIL